MNYKQQQVLLKNYKGFFIGSDYCFRESDLAISNAKFSSYRSTYTSNPKELKDFIKVLSLTKETAYSDGSKLRSGNVDSVELKSSIQDFGIDWAKAEHFITVPISDFKHLKKYGKSALAKKDIRYYLLDYLMIFDKNKNYDFIASNGHCLYKQFSSDLTIENKLRIPPQILEFLAFSDLQHIDIFKAGNHFYIKHDETIIQFSEHNNYPSFDQALKNQMIVDLYNIENRADFINKLKIAKNQNQDFQLIDGFFYNPAYLLNMLKLGSNEISITDNYCYVSNHKGYFLVMGVIK